MSRGSLHSRVTDTLPGRTTLTFGMKGTCNLFWRGEYTKCTCNVRGGSTTKGMDKKAWDKKSR